MAEPDPPGRVGPDDPHDPRDPADPSDPGDPHRAALYRAEHRALPDGGRRFTRFAQIETWVQELVLGPVWEELFPDAPLEVTVMRRSRGATFSAAYVPAGEDAAAIWIRDGSWDAATVLHELAHVAVGADPGPDGSHGERFATALLRLWRAVLGVHAYGALRSCLDDQGVPYQRGILD